MYADIVAAIDQYVLVKLVPTTGTENPSGVTVGVPKLVTLKVAE